MKKINKLILLFLSIVLLSGCSSLFVNEIHNKSYHAEIDIKEFENLTQAAIEKAAPAVIGVSNYQKTLIGGSRLTSTGSGVIYSCQAKMKNGSIEPDCGKTLDSDQV
ncbi:MAG: hypothetical protein M0R05_06660, partial [Bacilli bacterium]|nr:hypothetical protein [Bacilli bacterium]